MGVRLAHFAVLSLMAVVSPDLAGETIQVTVDKLKFDPAEVSAHVGDTIGWTRAALSHTRNGAKRGLRCGHSWRKGLVASRCNITARSTTSAAFTPT